MVYLNHELKSRLCKVCRLTYSNNRGGYGSTLTLALQLLRVPEHKTIQKPHEGKVL